MDDVFWHDGVLKHLRLDVGAQCVELDLDLYESPDARSRKPAVLTASGVWLSTVHINVNNLLDNTSAGNVIDCRFDQVRAKDTRTLNLYLADGMVSLVAADFRIEYV